MSIGARIAAAGQRDTLIEFQALATVTEPGYPAEAWATLLYAWAHRQDESGTEPFVMDQQTARLQTKWTIDYRPSLDPTLVDVPAVRRIKHRGRVYDITAAAMVGREGAIELLTVAKAG